MLRNVFERRAELALFSSVGYRSSALSVLVLAENGFLLGVGLLIGAAAALLSVAPRLLEDPGSLPWASLVITLMAVAGVGMISGAVAAFVALRAPLLEALQAP